MQWIARGALVFTLRKSTQHMFSPHTFAVAEYPALMLLAIAPQQRMPSATHWMLASLVMSFRSSRFTSP